jgi:integrase
MNTSISPEKSIIPQNSTLLEYERRVRKLLSDFADDTGMQWSEIPHRVADWFREKAVRMAWSRNTFWLYRSALLWFMESNGPVEETKKLRSVVVDFPARGDATSSLKLKKCPQKIFDELIMILSSSKSEMDGIILRWLKAGLASGLRPSEWAGAEMNGGTLTVRNAKTNAVRGNGEKRSLIFSLPEHMREIADIHAFLHDVRSWTGQGGTFSDLYHKCRRRLTYISRGNLLDLKTGQAISLYSTRHQFAADMKASGVRKNLIAALMGHGSEETATFHYARARDGRKRIPPRSPENEMLRVRREKNACRRIKRNDEGKT